MEELESTDSAVDLAQPLAASYFNPAPGQPSAGPSHRDPQQVPSFADLQHDRPPVQDAAFDRFYSLVEVCAAAGSPLTPLIPSSSYNHSPPTNIPYPFLPPLSSMVRAPPSDTEDERGSISSFHNDPTMLHANRRKHACKMCDKAFDRPSTLKTHLLVHTGITPFACHLCGRRFGVQSNCNRHIRRCTTRSELFLARRVEFESSQPGHPRPSATQHPDLTQVEPRASSRSLSPPTPSPPKPKRARRKRSPAATWVPQSLASFTLLSTHTPAPVPLPPVSPRIEHEERDSYITCHDQPYTEEGWSGRLPGPAPLYDSPTKTSSNNLRRRNTSRR